MVTEANRLAGQDAAGLDELPRRRTGVVEAHRGAVQAVDQEEGERGQEKSIVLLEVDGLS